MNNLYITGGRQRPSAFSADKEWRAFEKAIIVRLDTDNADGKICVEYETPPDARADDTASICFKSGAISGNKLYVCTSTEVLVYEVPGFRRLAYVSLPCFNDLHHVVPTREGNLIAVSTGLDMVIEFTDQGIVLRQWNAAAPGEDPWGRFSRDTDYRKMITMKPYKAHPNFVFWIEKNLWVTRCDLKDAVSLSQPGTRIDIGLQYVHDGLLFGGKLYFTTVDGRLVIANPQTFRVDEVIDLRNIDNQEEMLLGFCRGVWMVDATRAWIGFTRVRKTKFKDKVLWAKHGFKELEKPTHIALYDIAAKKCLQDINLEQYGMNAVFSILPAT
jgi:hypothetical protein